MPQNSISVEKASTLLSEAAILPTAHEAVPLADALGRICFQDVSAQINHPPFDRSPLDGFALFHEDVAGASPDSPAVLRVCQQIFAGDVPSGPVARGEAARIMTGAPIPPGADCVIRQEDTRMEGEFVLINCSAGPHDNICDKGEDLEEGAPIVRRGEKLSAAHIGVLASQGWAEVAVYRRPRIGILTTGDELAPPGAPLPPGKIYNSNQFYLAARLTELGMIPIIGGCGGDNPDTLTREIRLLLESCDAVITTGGVSVGARDFLPQVGDMLGASQLFHGVSVKPGSPMLAMILAGKPIVCLSGNPFAAAATLELVARPMLLRLAGHACISLRRAIGVLNAPFYKASSSRRLVRAHIENGIVSLPGGKHISGALSALIGCNCLIDIPANSPALLSGATVEVVLL